MLYWFFINCVVVILIPRLLGINVVKKVSTIANLVFSITHSLQHCMLIDLVRDFDTSPLHKVQSLYYKQLKTIFSTILCNINTGSLTARAK